MATAGQADPRDALFEHVVDRVNLDPDAQAMLRQLLSSVDAADLSSSTRLSRAMQSMDRLVERLIANPVRRGPVSLPDVEMALRDLCPLFPIC